MLRRCYVTARPTKRCHAWRPVLFTYGPHAELVASVGFSFTDGQSSGGLHIARGQWHAVVIKKVSPSVFITIGAAIIFNSRRQFIPPRMSGNQLQQRVCWCLLQIARHYFACTVSLHKELRSNGTRNIMMAVFIFLLCV